MKSFNPPIRTLMGNVLTGEENTRPFECDGLSVYRQKPLAVVLPQSVEQIKQVLKICKAHNTRHIQMGVCFPHL
jgi:glycolate oxidase